MTSDAPKKAVLGLGTNIGDRQENLRCAVDALNCLISTDVVKKSEIYETEPWGYSDQANFLNMCVMVDTRLSPRALLGSCLGIEAAMGRVRQFKNGPRIIDIDLLLYENFSSDDDELSVPHKRMREREFVLLPLSDILDDGKFFGDDFTAEIAKLKKR